MSEGTPQADDGADGDLARLRSALFDTSAFPSAVLTPGGEIRDANGSLACAYGEGRHGPSMVGRNLAALIAAQADGDPRAVALREHLAALAAGADESSWTDSRPATDHAPAYVAECRLTAMRDRRGRLEAVLFEAADQTARFDEAQQLQRRELEFERLAEVLPHMVWIADPLGRMTYFSPRWIEFSGLPPERLVGYRYLSIVPEEDQQALLVRSPDAPGPMRFRMRRHDGELRWMEARVEAVRDEAGEVLMWVGGTLDITDQRIRDADEREQAEQLRATLAMTGFGRYTLYFREQRITGDARLSEILGVDAEELMRTQGLNGFFAQIHSDDEITVREAVEAATVPGGPDYAVEYRMWRPHPDGGTEERWILALGRVEFDDDGAVRMVGVVGDITDRRREEDARLRTQKLEVVGTMAAGIAHDFNNVIAAIQSNAQLARHEATAGVMPLETIDDIERAAERAGELVRRLLGFSRPTQAERALFSLADIAQEAASLLRPTMAPGVRLTVNVTDPTLRVLGTASEIHQVLVNLITNAAQALDGESGTIEITIDGVTLSGGPGLGTERLRPGGYARLRVHDSGPGISDVVARRAFDPFFTTKTAGRGTGLGLAAAQTIVRTHHGTIEIKGQAGSGTTVTVCLPLSDGAVPAEETAPRPADVRVMFVDDEPALARLADRALAPQGMIVRTFTHPVDALDAFREDPAAIDVVVTDFSMPGLTGVQLSTELLLLRPDLPIILTSGNLSATDETAARAAGVVEVVAKPFSIETLVSLIQLHAPRREEPSPGAAGSAAPARSRPAG